jgi:DGQHR domain-containing protein
MALHTPSALVIPAIRMRQGQGRELYLFGVDGKQLEGFAAISRIRREGDGELAGYQRPEVLSHIAEIRKYIESDGALLPNAIIIAFDSRVQFTGNGPGVEGSTAGMLTIPLAVDPVDRVGFVVDGQQRTAALRDARIAAFPVPIVGFIANGEQEQREQFILVNSTKPLPKSLIHELLPATDAALPARLAKRRLPSLLTQRLNRDDDSPLRGMVESSTSPNGTIKDNSLMRMIEHSLSDGLLYRLATTLGEDAPDLQVNVLKAYWGAVADSFPTDWGKPPRKSRLMHGAGIVALGFIMDAIADRLRPEIPSRDQFAEALAVIAPHCRWSEGSWDFGRGMTRKWSEVQNTSRDVMILSNHLLQIYRLSVRERSTAFHPQG